MSSSAPRHRCFASVVAIAVIAAAGSGRGAWGAEASPFIPDDAPPAAAPSVPDPMTRLEFAGLARIGPQLQVYLFEPRTRRGQWLELGVALDGLLAEEFDAERQAVRVRAGSHVRWLTLRGTTITGVPMVLQADRSIDWDHMKLTDRQKEVKAAGQIWEMMEVTRQLRLPDPAEPGRGAGAAAPRNKDSPGRK